MSNHDLVRIHFTKTGFPQFEPYTKAQVKIDFFTGRSLIDRNKAWNALKKQCEQQSISFEPYKQLRDSGQWVWHQVEDCQTMQLIPKVLNRGMAHMGGAALSRRGIYLPHDPHPNYQNDSRKRMDS